MEFRHAYNRNSFVEFLLCLTVICLAYVVFSMPYAFLANEFETAGTQFKEQELQLMFGSNVTLLLQLLPFAGVLIAFIFVAKILNWPFLSLVTSRDQFDWNRVGFGFVLWLALSLFGFILNFSDAYQWNFNFYYFLCLLIVAAIFLFIQCLAEELLFRSLLLKWAGIYINRGWALIVFTGVIFGLMHIGNPEVSALGSFAIAYYIITGVLLGLVVHMDDGLELSLGFHFANNFFIAIMVTSTWSAFQTDALFVDSNSPIFGFKEFAISVSSHLLFILICALRYKWPSLKLKLF